MKVREASAKPGLEVTGGLVFDEQRAAKIQTRKQLGVVEVAVSRGRRTKAPSARQPILQVAIFDAAEQNVELAARVARVGRFAVARIPVECDLGRELAN